LHACSEKGVNARRHHNDVWLSVAQAFMPEVPDVRTALSHEAFTMGTGPIRGLWQAV
jgi:hypothetical protein